MSVHGSIGGRKGQGFAAGLAEVLLVLMLAVLPLPLAHAEPQTLHAVAQKIARQHARIGHVTPAEAARLIEAGNVALLDVRGEAEYAVSRIPGAIRIDPGTTGALLVARHGPALAGRAALFYCSVGVRSSRLAERVREDVLRAGAVEVLNLEGGIFAWHNERRPLADGAGPTDHIHPYDRSWGRLIERQDLVRTLRN